jgi:6-phosphogluconolactonase
MIVANQNGGGILVYRIDQKTGKLVGVTTKIDIENPVCLKLVSAE